MKTNHLDDQMNAVLVAVIASVSIATALGVGEGESFGRGGVQVSEAVAKTLVARAPQAPAVARITVHGKRPVVVVASSR